MNFTQADIDRLNLKVQKDGTLKRETHTGQTLVTGKYPERYRNSVIVIPGIVHGLNGDKGLIRSHWSKRGKLKKLYCQIVNDHLVTGQARKHEGKVKVLYRGYKSSFMDWDNFCGSGKLVLDSLVACGVITDDSPAVIVSFIPEQIKCKRKEQRVEITVADL